MQLTSADIRRINADLRARDESHLWPISGEFNATERAIRRTRNSMALGLTIDDPESYRAVVESEISRIVNSVNS